MLNNQVCAGYKKNRMKGVVQISKEIGETFCYEGFPGCNKKSFYYRYIDTCKIAHNKSKNEVKKPVWENDKLLPDAESKLQAESKGFRQWYIKVAYEELARYNDKLIESSNKKYLEKISRIYGFFFKCHEYISKKWVTSPINLNDSREQSTMYNPKAKNTSDKIFSKISILARIVGEGNLEDKHILEIGPIWAIWQRHFSQKNPLL